MKTVYELECVFHRLLFEIETAHDAIMLRNKIKELLGYISDSDFFYKSKDRMFHASFIVPQEIGDKWVKPFFEYVAPQYELLFNKCLVKFLKELQGRTDNY